MNNYAIHPQEAELMVELIAEVPAGHMTETEVVMVVVMMVVLVVVVVVELVTEQVTNSQVSEQQ